MQHNSLEMIDWYKADHRRQYPDGTNLVFSNLTPRKCRISDINGNQTAVFFGLQYFIQEYLTTFIDRMNVSWFRDTAESSLGMAMDDEHFRQLEQMRRLPLCIYALPEGISIPAGIPAMVMWNTHPDAYWLVNYLETILSACVWQPSTSATIAKLYRGIFEMYAKVSSDTLEAVNFQGHDFSFRGMSSLETAAVSGAGHLLAFDGSDTVPAISLLRNYYRAFEPLGFSVPATEHSVMCAGTREAEIDTFRRIMGLYPTGIVSIVSDTWDYWKVLTEMLPTLKKEIMTRNGKVVIRPDSSKKTPLEIICGDPEGETEAEKKGSVQLLWEIFGGTTNSKGFKVLDPHIGLIYGDSITPSLAAAICERLIKQGFASTNWVAGIGSYTYQYNTRDTLGWAMKATYVEVNGEPRNIFKNPATDNGTKKSAQGLLAVYRTADGQFQLKQNASWDDVKFCSFQKVFEDGHLFNQPTLDDIRRRVRQG